MPKLDQNDAVGTTTSPEWEGVLNKLILGATHNISNRVATLAGVSDILAGDPSIPPILRALADEVPKLEESLRLLRLLAVPEDEAEEPLEPLRAVDDAIALARLHPDCKDVAFTVEERGDVPPVVARPTVLVHHILLLLVSAAQELRDSRAELRAGPELVVRSIGYVRLTRDGAILVMSVAGQSIRVPLLMLAT